MKKSTISIDKAIEINKSNMKLFSDLCKVLKHNIKDLEKEKNQGKVDTDNFTKIQIDYKSYYVPKEKKKEKKINANIRNRTK